MAAHSCEGICRSGVNKDKICGLPAKHSLDDKNYCGRHINFYQQQSPSYKLQYKLQQETGRAKFQAAKDQKLLLEIEKTKLKRLEIEQNIKSDLTENPKRGNRTGGKHSRRHWINDYKPGKPPSSFIEAMKLNKNKSKIDKIKPVSSAGPESEIEEQPISQQQHVPKKYNIVYNCGTDITLNNELEVTQGSKKLTFIWSHTFLNIYPLANLIKFIKDNFDIYPYDMLNKILMLQIELDLAEILHFNSGQHNIKLILD